MPPTLKGWPAYAYACLQTRIHVITRVSAYGPADAHEHMCMYLRYIHMAPLNQRFLSDFCSQKLARVLCTDG